MKVENPFTSKLYNHTLPVREELWEAIEKRLPPNEDKKRLPLFWLVLFASTLLSGALMFGFISKSQKPGSQTTPTPSYTLSESTPLSNTESSDFTSNLSSQASTPNSASPTPAQEEASSVASNRQLPNAYHSGRTHPNTSKAKKQLNSGSANIVQVAQDAIETKDLSVSTTQRSTHITSLLPFIDINPFDKPRVDVIGTRRFKPDPSCYKFSSIAGNYYISADAFVGPGISPRSFTYAGSELSTYMHARNTTENNQYAWSAGARINLHLQSGLAFRLGIMYDQAGDVFDYTDTLATQSTTRVDSFFAADGTFLYSDTSRILIFGTLIKKIHNTYRHLDVPLLVSYELSFGRSTLMINAGPVFNLSASYEGQILDPMLHPRTITRGAQNELNAYKTSLGISLYFGAGAVFPINDHFSAVVEPRYLYRIKPVTIKSYPLEEHRHYAGLNLGLRYILD